MGLLERDPDELFEWIRGVAIAIPAEKAGSFLSYIASAALHADHENLEIIRPALEQLRKKYPHYEKKATP